MDKTCTYGVYPTKQPRCQPIEDWTYWPVLGSINNCNTIHLTNKTKSSQYFGVVHKVVVDGISENMASLLQLLKYSAIDAADPTTIGYYVMKYLSEPYTLQLDQTKYGKVSKEGEIVVKSEYLSIMKAKTS